MSELVHLPETMRPQWLAFERALRRWVPTQGFDQQRVDLVMVEVQAHYLACAAPDGELRSDGHEAAFADLQDWAVLVAYRLAVRLVGVELNRNSAAATAAAPAELPAGPAWPPIAARQWHGFCADVRRSTATTYSRATVDAALAALAPLWPELARPLPALTVWRTPDGTEQLLRHLNDWAFSKQLAMLQGLARAEHARLMSAPAPSPSTAAAPSRAAVLPFPARCDSG